MTSQPPRSKLVVVTTLVLIFVCTAVLGLGIPAARAQGPAADRYEENDTISEASAIPSAVTLPNMTIFPAKDPDYWRIVAVPGPLNISVIATPGLDLTLTLYGPSGEVVQENNDPASPNGQLSYVVPAAAYYIIGVTSTTELDGFYELRVFNAAPTATPTPTNTQPPPPTRTPQPTATGFIPTNTPTPDLGGAPDFAEPNYDFPHAYRMAPGDQLQNLNFNSGQYNVVDNDFFVMAARAGVHYTCRTKDLGPNLDTNMIIYGSADTNDLIGGNDDENTQAGLINSLLAFTPVRDADIYILVGYKFPAGSDLRYPGNATYTLTCTTDAPTPSPSGGAGGGGGMSGSGMVSGTPQATPLSFELIAQPTITASPTPNPVTTMVVDVVIAYDANMNKTAEPAEGIRNLSVRIIDLTTNREITQGYTDEHGTAHFVIATNGKFRLVIPFLSASREFTPNASIQWMLLIPAANAPGLIP